MDYTWLMLGAVVEAVAVAVTVAVAAAGAIAVQFHELLMVEQIWKFRSWHLAWRHDTILGFYIATSCGRIVDKPTPDSINTIAEWFFARFTRITGTEINEKDRSEVYKVSVPPHRRG